MHTEPLGGVTPSAGGMTARPYSLPATAPPLLLVLPLLAASLLLPWQAGWVCAMVVIILLGVPHGALDVEIGRNLLRQRLGRAWFPVFALPYLALVAAVLVAWRWAPEPTLAAFLLASVWHFGAEEAGGGLAALALGGIPVAVPVLVHPAATAQVLSAASSVALTTPPAWLTVGSLIWLLIAALWMVRSIAAGGIPPDAAPHALRVLHRFATPLGLHAVLRCGSA